MIFFNELSKNNYTFHLWKIVISNVKVSNMEWLVVDTIVCSSSGISFSILWCKIKLIIWYESDVFLPPGSSVSQTDSGIYIDGKFFPLTIYNVTSFNKIFWKIIECSNECPGRQSIKGAQCTSALHCRIAICPYGLIK